MTARTYTVDYGDGRTETLPMSDAMAASMDKLSAWDGWCKCDAPEAVDFEERGHSVDVFCRCGGCLQIG